MYTSRITLFLLTLVVALASAAPLRSHHRRGKCPHKPATGVVDDNTDTPSPLYTPSVSIGDSSLFPSPTSQKPKNGKPKTSMVYPEPTETPEPSETSEPSDNPEPEKPTKTSKSSPSSSASDDEPTPTKKSSSGSGSGGSLDGLLGDLFPIGSGSTSWSTCPESSKPIPLSDAALKATRIDHSLNHQYIDNPDGDGKVLKAHYPKGSLNPASSKKGGVSFYAKGPIDLSNAEEVSFGYSVFFPPDFDFVRGGKLPGPYGGNNDDTAVGCSGGARKDSCFSARLMWRTAGAGEFYLYLPPSPSANQAACKRSDFECNDTYGASVGRGKFTFPRGKWTTVSQRVKLNDPSQANGELELFVNGESIIKINGIQLRTEPGAGVMGLMVQSFFGGSSAGFENSKDQDVYFKDFSCAIIR